MKIRNQHGSSLIELMVAVVVLGAVTLGFTTMISNVMNQQKIAQSRQDLADVGLEVQTVFSNPNFCKSSLAGAPFDASQATVTYDASKPFAFNGMPFKLKINGADTLQDNTDLKNYNLTVKHFQIVNAKDMGPDTGGNEIYSAQLIGHFAPKNYSGNGISDFAIRNLSSGYLSVNGTNVVGCSSASPPTQQTAQTTCTALGGTYAAGKCSLPSSGSTSAGVGSSSGVWTTTAVHGAGCVASSGTKGPLEGQSCPTIAGTSGDTCYTYTCVASGGSGSTTSASSSPANNAAIANDPAFMGALCANLGGTVSGTKCALTASSSGGAGGTGKWVHLSQSGVCPTPNMGAGGSCSPVGLVQTYDATAGGGGGIHIPCMVSRQCQ